MGSFPAALDLVKRVSGSVAAANIRGSESLGLDAKTALIRNGLRPDHQEARASKDSHGLTTGGI